MKTQVTKRGFGKVSFEDDDGTQCSIQKSSSMPVNKIWLGSNEIGLKEFKAGVGWKDVELANSIEHHFVANNRMHLTQDQVKSILPVLTKFAETGEL